MYRKEQTEHREQLADTMMTPVTVFLFFMVYSVSAPTSEKGQGYLLFYPIYDLTCL